MEESVKNAKLIWDRCLQYIKSRVNEQSFKTWFIPIIPQKIEKDTLTIQVPSKFFYEWLEENYLDILTEIISKELGDKGKLAYSILINSPQITEKKIEETKPDKKSNFEKKISTRFENQNYFSKKYTFDNFIEGDSNRLAKSAAQAVSKKPGETSFNPLMIYADVGLGKTHIMHALAYETKLINPEKKCFYLSSESFTSQFIEAIRNNETQEFVNYYINSDVLLIDDIQFLTGKEKTQEMFFHIFNHLHRYGKQIVISSDCPPTQLKGMHERLLSRFKWGLTTDIQKPDFETKIAIIDSKLIQNDIKVPLNLIKYIASSINTNIRDLEGTIVSLIAHASLNDSQINFELVKQVLSNIVQKVETEINIKYLQKLVSEYMQISEEEMRGSSRKKEIVIARQLAMYLSKNYTSHSLKSIGEYFGGKHHSTVIHAMQAVEDMLATEKNIRKQLSAMTDMIKLKMPQN
ncbi:MAG: chromosomal replication initiator protein DnaA [Bacteroidetes bacterium]|nr:chromosomal replication initiator protein DnaA [Bacteroidota bacterium]